MHCVFCCMNWIFAFVKDQSIVKKANRAHGLPPHACENRDIDLHLQLSIKKLSNLYFSWFIDTLVVWLAKEQVREARWYLVYFKLWFPCELRDFQSFTNFLSFDYFKTYLSQFSTDFVRLIFSSEQSWMAWKLSTEVRYVQFGTLRWNAFFYS